MKATQSITIWKGARGAGKHHEAQEGVKNGK